MNILAIIVVYGQHPKQSPAFDSLLRCRDAGQRIRVIVWDNSPEPLVAKEERFQNKIEIEYISTPENVGLSRIYNHVISAWLSSNEFLLILDQDTCLPDNFFRALAHSLTQFPSINLFLPMIKARGRWVSPLSYFYGWGRYWKSRRVGLVRSCMNMAINSGMVIRGAYLKSKQPIYDERLRFYGTDTQFMVAYSRENDRFCVIDAIVEHDLSFFSSSGIERIEKFGNMKAGYQIIYEKSPVSTKVVVSVVMALVSVVYAIRYSSWSYFRNGMVGRNDIKSE